MSDVQFANGINVRAIDTKYGQLIKLGINKDAILDNPYNERGWVNIVLKTSKAGNMYAEIDTYNPNGNNTPEATPSQPKEGLVEFGEMEAVDVEPLVDEEEIPF